MDLTVEVNAFKELLPTASTFVVLLPDSTNRDSVAAALSLYLSLNQYGKSVTIACPRPAIVGWSQLVGVNKMTQNLGNKNFVISLDYTEGAIEKVSYNIEGSKFNLVIEPRPGAPLFNEKKVSYSYSGFVADVIVGVGAPTVEGFGKYYFENKPLFTNKPIVAIDNRATTRYGKINFVRPTTICEIVTYVLRLAELPLNSDIASNLYDGIVTGSRTFTTPGVNADTFDAAAFLLRQGARRGSTRQEELPDREFVQTKPEAPQAPPDWLKPKIYKGSQLL